MSFHSHFHVPTVTLQAVVPPVILHKVLYSLISNSLENPDVTWNTFDTFLCK